MCISRSALFIIFPFITLNLYSQNLQRPRGIYSIDVVSNKPFVDGVALRTRWSDLQPSQGVYNFSSITSTVSAAYAANKKVTLVVGTGGIPSWMIPSVATYNHPQYGTTAVPWDTFMLARLERLVDTVSKVQVNGFSLSNHPAITQVNSSIGGLQSIRLTNANIIPGYSRQQFAYGVFRSIHAFVAKFPNDFPYVGLFPIGDGMVNPTTAEYLRDTLLTVFNGVNLPLIGFFQENWTGLAPVAQGTLGQLLVQVRYRTFIMLQACGAWSNQGQWPQCNWLTGDHPDSGFRHGVYDIGSLYFELYPNDLNNLTFESIFLAWHDSLMRIIVGVKELETSRHSVYELSQNYPNPFNPTTEIRYQTSEVSHVSLKVYDILGREVATLVDGVKEAGVYNYQFSVHNSPFASGVYFYQLSAGRFVQTKKMIVIQ